MQKVFEASSRAVRKVPLVGLAAVVAAILSVGVLVAPAEAQAADGSGAHGSTATTMAAASTQLTAQASVDQTAAADAKKIIAKAKATSGTATEKLAKIYTFISKDKSFGGKYQFENLPFFYSKYGSTYYSMLPSRIVSDALLDKYYKKYAVDMFATNRGTCFHYASLFAVTAKQALGNAATVKLAAGASKHTGSRIDNHAWVEITMGSKTYIYDPQAGNTTSKTAKKATSFGKFCGAQKSKLKANYYKYKGVHYITVK